MRTIGYYVITILPVGDHAKFFAENITQVGIINFHFPSLELA
jgi:hypothetical protein